MRKLLWLWRWQLLKKVENIIMAKTTKKCPGGKIRSKGKGLGLGKGEGKGPIGKPYKGK